MHFIVVQGPDAGSSFTLPPRDAFIVGRGKESHTALQDPRVSRKHCEIVCDGDRLILRDSGSAGGTYVNGERVEQCELAPGDVIRIGDSQLRVEAELPVDRASQETVGPKTKPAAIPARQRDMSHLVGQTLHKYTLVKQIASGMTGAVFLAERVETKEPRAVKVLWPEISQDEQQMQRFVRAIKTMQPIRHPNIVRIHDAGVSHKMCWFGMEYVPGESLQQVIERFGAAGMLDWQTAFRVALQMARALDTAHEHKIVHRNITPKNILWNREQRVAKLGDLMLAKALEESNAQQITRPGEILGSLPYVSPESTAADPKLDCRSDIYGLGATIYATLTGRPPFESKSRTQLLKQIQEETPRRPKEFQLAIADVFEGAVMKMLAKKPDDRYTTPRALLQDLERIGKYQGLE